MKYREEVEKLSLDGAQRERIAAALRERRAAGRAEQARVRKRALAAASLSAALALIVAAPIGIRYGLKSATAKDQSAGGPSVEDPNGTQTPGGEKDPDSGSTGTDPEPPDGEITPPELIEGVDGRIVDCKPMYAADETIFIRYRAVAGTPLTETKVENGFSVVSCTLISSAEKRPRTEYTYQIQLKAAEAGEHLSGGVRFETEDGNPAACILYGYRPAEGPHADGTIYTSTVSQDDAFGAYLRFLVGLGEITDDEYHDRLSEYWRESGAVREKIEVMQAH